MYLVGFIYHVDNVFVIRIQRISNITIWFFRSLINHYKRILLYIYIIYMYVFIVFNYKFETFVKICKISINILKYALFCKIYQICKNMYIHILDLIWDRETNLFRTLLYITILKKSMQILKVPKPSNYNTYSTHCTLLCNYIF
jgi:hypothetical protein